MTTKPGPPSTEGAGPCPVCGCDLDRIDVDDERRHPCAYWALQARCATAVEAARARGWGTPTTPRSGRYGQPRTVEVDVVEDMHRLIETMERLPVGYPPKGG